MYFICLTNYTLDLIDINQSLIDIDDFSKSFQDFISPFSFIIRETKLTPFSEKSLKKIYRLSTLIFLLNHKNSDNIINGTVEAER